jgi:hypothetical protein
MNTEPSPPRTTITDAPSAGHSVNTGVETRRRASLLTPETFNAPAITWKSPAADLPRGIEIASMRVPGPIAMAAPSGNSNSASPLSPISMMSPACILTPSTSA